VGGTCGTFNGGLVALFRPARPLSFLVGDLVLFDPAVCCVEFEPFELSGGIEVFEEEYRLCCGRRVRACWPAPRVTTAVGRPAEHTAGDAIPHVVRTALPTAGENMAADR
jgi:hypothetical protein